MSTTEEVAMEERQDEIERLLRRCSTEELAEVATCFAIPVAEWKDHPKKNHLRAIQSQFDTLTTLEEKSNAFQRLPAALPDRLGEEMATLLTPPPLEDDTTKDVFFYV